ncbi:hypothetical protein IV505_14825 [Pseudomonas fulva]|nr:hypothetical protein [Pseudomonas fulva]MBF8780988.1 hypothetical protein [Pseudomonas fulva]
MDTNKMMPEAMLAQFDAAFRAKFGCSIAEAVGAQDESAMAMMGAAMWAWQASRENLRVTNPFPVVDGDPDVLWAHAKAQKSLEAQGFKVTP